VRSPVDPSGDQGPVASTTVRWVLIVVLLALLGPIVALVSPAGVASAAPVPAGEPTVPGPSGSPADPAAVVNPMVTVRNRDADGKQVLRFDTTGAAIDAHDGSVQQFTYQGKTRYYWYGTQEDCGLGWLRTKYAGGSNPTPWCGFGSYASDDLTTWTYQGTIASGKDPQWQNICGWLSCWRPKVVYNPNTGQYVAWANTILGPSGYSAWTSPSPTGPWTFRGHPTVFTNAGSVSGYYPANQDESLFVDDSGVGYAVIIDAVTYRPVVERLTDDFLNSTLQVAPLPVTGVEAPTMFRRGGRYYMFVGTPNRGYASTGTSYLWATDPLGPWTSGGLLSNDSFGGQGTHAARWNTTDGRTIYVFESDLWHHRDLPSPFGYPNQGLAGFNLSPITWAVDGVTPVLAPATQWDEKLRFVDTAQSDQLLAGSAYHSPNPGPWYYSCDVRSGVRRSFTFRAPASGVLTDLKVNVARSEYPNDNAYLDLTAGANVGGAIALSTGVIPASGPGWTARPYTWRPDVTVTAGATYTVTLRSGNTASDYSCFGFVYQAGSSPMGAAGLSVAGGSWTATDETVKFDLAIKASVPKGPTVVAVPTRLTDTSVQAGYDTVVKVAGVGGAPLTGVIGAWVNVTVDHPAAAGALAAYPSDGTTTVANAFPYRTGDVRAYAALVRVGDDGAIRVSSSANARIVVDLTGWVMDDTSSGAPARLSVLPTAQRALDTRVSHNAPGPGGTVDVLIGGASVPAGAAAALVNLTGVAPTSPTYLALFPSDSAWNGTSNLNLVANEVARSNRVLVRLSPDGHLRILNQSGVTDIVIDVVGYVTATGGSTGKVAPLDPAAAPAVTAFPANPQTYSVAVGGLQAAGGTGPQGSAILSAFERSAAHAGFLVVYPTADARPPTSDLNYPAGVGITTMNLTVTRLGGTTTVQVATNTNDGTTSLAVTGYVT